MAVRVFSTTLLGIDAVPIDVETEVMVGLRRFNIVGLPDGVVKEAKDRVRCSLENSGFQFPHEEVVVSLAPAALPKIGSGFDVAIALSVLAASGGIDPVVLDGKVFVGELALDGRIKEVGSELGSAIQVLRSKKANTLVVSSSARKLLECFDGLSVFYVSTLFDLVTHLKNGTLEEQSLSSEVSEVKCLSRRIEILTFKDVVGQHAAKRALQVAAAGAHNLLMIGPPGAGKTMLAERIISILPPLEREEFLEVNQIYRSLIGQGVSGFSGNSIMERRPFRSPHHSTSLAGLVGGGSIPVPGELTLSHKGVLFLDEFVELRRDVMESLREPLESKRISISRAKIRLTYPCDFMLIAAMNPCPCGKRGLQVSLEKRALSRYRPLCECSPHVFQRYIGKLSGPIMDRLDIQLWVPQVPFSELRSHSASDITSELHDGVLRARAIQLNRFQKSGKLNCSMSTSDLREYCRLDTGSELLLDAASKKFNFSARSYSRILKLARTIADLDESKAISSTHIAEAISYRMDISTCNA
ncbi:MAG TPA: YifB family Mg chelatase-like AAA ATPase [Oligoflexia bacterium]|nr:YifB family Mg chelatase-like AAA ATPase [Oligoflexia bacterium]HMP49647.1 YifB family Mg chelatase-like AAA ATPase [Oligoflexia bacterium]